MFSINIKRSVATVGVVAGLLAAAGPASAHGLKADGNEVAVEGITLAHAGYLTPVDDMDLSIRGDDTITQAREPQTVTMIDYMGSP